MPTRNLSFYTEVVGVTVMSLIAAYSWNYFMSDFIKDTPLSIKLIFAIVMTTISVFVLWSIFSNSKHTKDNNFMTPDPFPDVYYYDDYNDDKKEKK